MGLCIFIDSIIEPRAAIYLQLPHRSAQPAVGVPWAHFAHQAHLSKDNMVCRRKGLRHVKRAGATCPRTFHDMEVNHCSGDIRVPRKILNRPDVDAAFEEVGRKGMSGRVAGSRLG